MRSLAPVRLGVVVGVVAAVFGVIVGLLVGPAIAFVYGALPVLQMVRPYDGSFSVVPIVVVPVVAGVLGFVAGAVIALAYNVLARVTGGVEATLDERVVFVSPQNSERSRST